MKKFNLKKIITVSIFTVFGISNTLIKDSIAVNFSNTPLEQNSVIAIAQPSARNTYSLIIIQQISSQRPCWQEQGNNPILVQPLLLDFDFTGICERSTDSNGYSIRVAGEDIADQYRLQVVRDGNNLKLVGIPTKNRTLPRLEIGQTNGISNELSKIILNQGWSFSKRVYEGETLGHIYLTNETNLNTLIANAPNYRPTSVNNNSSNINTVTNNNSNNNLSNNVTESVTISSNSNSANDWIEFSSDNNSYQNNNNNNGNYEVNTNNNTTNNNNNTRTIPDFSSNPNVVPVPQPPSLNNNSGGVTPSPTPLASVLGFNYRVIVYTRNLTEENKVKTIVPDAFRTRIDNQVVLQAGLFVDRETADILQQQLSQDGLNARVIPVN